MAGTGSRPDQAMRIPRNVAVFVLGLLAAAGALGVIRLLREAPSDEELIRTLIEATAKGVDDRKPADVMAGVSERFQGEGLGYQELRQVVIAQVLRGSWNAAVPVSTRVDVKGDRAEAVVDVALFRGAKGEGVLGRLPESGDTWRFHVTLEREKSGWKVVAGRWRPIGALEEPRPEKP
jgi:hypothetical protein